MCSILPLCLYQFSLPNFFIYSKWVQSQWTKSKEEGKTGQYGASLRMRDTQPIQWSVSRMNPKCRHQNKMNNQNWAFYYNIQQTEKGKYISLHKYLIVDSNTVSAEVPIVLFCVWWILLDMFCTVILSQNNIKRIQFKCVFNIKINNLLNTGLKMVNIWLFTHTRQFLSILEIYTQLRCTWVPALTKIIIIVEKTILT